MLIWLFYLTLSNTYFMGWVRKYAVGKKISPWCATFNLSLGGVGIKNNQNVNKVLFMLQTSKF